MKCCSILYDTDVSSSKDKQICLYHYFSQITENVCIATTLQINLQNAVLFSRVSNETTLLVDGLCLAKFDKIT